MSELFQKLQPHLDRYYAFSAAATLFSWDNETVAPKAAIENTSRAIGILSGELYEALINDEVKQLLAKLSTEEEQARLSFQEKAIVKNLRKQYRQLQAIPPQEYQEFAALTAQAFPVWEKAKQENDYASYAPVLEKIIDYTRRFASYRQKKDQKLYDVQLEDYEEGFTVEILDDFFAKLKAALAPLVQKIREKSDTISTDCLCKNYDIDTQRRVCRDVAEYIGFDFNRGVMGESAHPFTTELHNHDVRITNHYLEHQLDSAIFSVIHEGGHALYEMDIDDSITMTPVGHGTSMGMHPRTLKRYDW